jgi:integrase
MPPELFDVLAGCPTTKVFKTRDRSTEPALAGLRDRALLPVGFVAALRRSELAALAVADVAEHANGLVLSLPRSKTNQTGEQAELVVLPRAGTPGRCPVTALQTWLAAAGITDGPVFRPVSTGNRVIPRPLHPESINALVQAAVARAGLDPAPYSAHSLRPGSSPTPTCAAPRTGRSPTRPGTAAWPAWVVTCASPPPGRTTPIS